MRMSRANFEKMMSFEDCYLTAKRDPTGVRMIGYGKTSGVRPGMTITQEEAEAELQLAIERIENVFMRMPVLPELPPNKWDALVSFAFKTGLTCFKKSVLLKKVQRNPNNKKIYIEFMRWIKGNEQTVKRMTLRRQWESKLWENEV